MVDDALQITGQTSAATQWLKHLLPTGTGQAPIPAAAYNVAAQLLANEAGIDAHPPSARTYVAGRTWVTLRASRLTSASPAEGSAIAVSVEETPGSQRLDLFARAHGLTGREQHLLRLLAHGLDTRELAKAMAIAIAEYTVQDHLKSVFAKTAAGSRNALITAALGVDQYSEGQ
jgi:DNA-binding CsgD family transcriptional regulator